MFNMHNMMLTSFYLKAQSKFCTYKADCRNVRVLTPQPAVSEEHYLHYTFLDSLGRTAVKLRFENIVDEKRGKELVVIYEYPRLAGFRKVIVVALAVLTIFVFRVVGGWALEGGIGGK
jgi:oligosaccharyltransferase complex subunit alpha (ribophorin I)